jgi:hypothetical protein
VSCTSWWHCTHNKRSSRTPATAADEGSNASLPSTTAHSSPSPVAAARLACNIVVRPDDRTPLISVIAPSGNPGSTPRKSFGVNGHTVETSGRGEAKSINFRNGNDISVSPFVRLLEFHCRGIGGRCQGIPNNALSGLNLIYILDCGGVG